MLKELKKCLEAEKKDNSVFDIIIYGSLMKGKTDARDVDILVIYLSGSLRERLEKIQEIKNRVRKIIGNIDIKQILLTDLFSPDFMAKTGVFLEGFSIFKNKKFCEVLGFKAYSLFSYKLEGLSHTQKVRFNYLLAGRGQRGIIGEFSGERLANGAVKIPIEHSLEFEDILKNNSISYTKEDILEAI